MPDLLSLVGNINHNQYLLPLCERLAQGIRVRAAPSIFFFCICICIYICICFVYLCERPACRVIWVKTAPSKSFPSIWICVFVWNASSAWIFVFGSVYLDLREKSGWKPHPANLSAADISISVSLLLSRETLLMASTVQDKVIMMVV